MTQSRLNRAVARATGESLSTIRRMGFSIMPTEATDSDLEPAAPNVIDWDVVEADRMVLFPVRQLCVAA
jgi:hypothetical protein